MTASAQAVIECEKSLAIVKDALGNRSAATGVYLPSWVPDWSIPLRKQEDLSPSRAEWRAGGSQTPVTQFTAYGGHNLMEIQGTLIDTLRGLRDDKDSMGRLFNGSTTLLFDTKSTVRSGDECWILRSFDWPVVLRRIESHYVIVAEVMIWAEQQIDGRKKTGGVRDSLWQPGK